MDALCHANCTTPSDFAKAPFTDEIDSKNCNSLCDFTARVHKAAENQNWALSMFLSPYYREIRGLESFACVTFLSVIRCRVKSLEGLEAPSLRFLFLDDNDILDLSPLNSLFKLEVVSLSFNPVEEVNFRSKTLTTLNLNSTKVKDTNFVDQFPDLKFLSLRNCRFVKLGGCCPNLRFLDISGCLLNSTYQLRQVFPNLESLVIKYHSINKLEELLDDYAFLLYQGPLNFPNLQFLDNIKINSDEAQKSINLYRANDQSYIQLLHISSKVQTKVAKIKSSINTAINTQTNKIHQCIGMIQNDLDDFSLLITYRQKQGQYINQSEQDTLTSLQQSVILLQQYVGQLKEGKYDLCCMVEKEEFQYLLPLKCIQQACCLDVCCQHISETDIDPDDVQLKETANIMKAHLEGAQYLMYQINNERINQLCINEMLQKIEMYGPNNEKVQHNYEVFRQYLKQCTSYYYISDENLIQIQEIITTGVVSRNSIGKEFIPIEIFNNIDIKTMQSVLVVQVIADKEEYFILPQYFIVFTDNMFKQDYFDQGMVQVIQSNKIVDDLLNQYSTYVNKPVSLSFNSYKNFEEVLIDRLSNQSSPEFLDLHNSGLPKFDIEQQVINEKSSILKLNISFNNLQSVFCFNFSFLKWFSANNCHINLDKCNINMPNCRYLNLSGNMLSSPLLFLQTFDLKTRQQVQSLDLFSCIDDVSPFIPFFVNYFKQLTHLNGQEISQRTDNDYVLQQQLDSSSQISIVQRTIHQLQSFNSKTIDVTGNGSIIIPSIVTKYIVDSKTSILHFINTGCRFFQSRSLVPVLSQLQVLNLSGCDLGDFSSMFDNNKIENLVHLNLSGAKNLANLNFLQKLPKLVILILNDTCDEKISHLLEFVKQLSQILFSELLSIDFYQSLQLQNKQQSHDIDVRFSQLVRRIAPKLQAVSTPCCSLPTSLLLISDLQFANGVPVTKDQIKLAKSLLTGQVTSVLIKECAQLSQDGKYLKLNGLGLKSLEYDARDSNLVELLSTVEFVDSRDNQLKDLSWLKQGLYPRIKHLNLRNNQFVDPFNCSCSSDSLEVLDLSENPISKVQKTQNCKLLKVKKLLLNSCASFRSPGSQSFAFLQSLQTIEWTNASFMNASKETFLSLQNLTSLTLSSNLLRDLEMLTSLLQYNVLNYLDIRDNRISSLQPVLQFVNKLGSLQELWVEGNPFCKTRQAPAPAHGRANSEPPRATSGSLWYLDSFIEWTNESIKVVDGVQVSEADVERVRALLLQREEERRQKAGVIGFGFQGPPRQLSGIGFRKK